MPKPKKTQSHEDRRAAGRARISLYVSAEAKKALVAFCQIEGWTLRQGLEFLILIRLVE